MKKFTLFEVSKTTGLSEETVIRYIKEEWISPEEENLDQEDLARIKLIIDLQSDLGVNDESIPIILHLIDQLHFLKNKIINSDENM